MTKRWYIVHAYSNFEKKVAESIREYAGQRGLADKFDEILVPTEQVVEVRRGRIQRHSACAHRARRGHPHPRNARRARRARA